jgi:sn-glycerol 3-phosphate transport system permease protein
MIENRPLSTLLAYFWLVIGVLVVAFPIWYTFAASTQTLRTILSPPLPLTLGPAFLDNYGHALFGGLDRIGGVSLARLLYNTTVVALAIAIGKIVISILSAYAVVFFRFPGRMVFFWMIFVTLMLPVEVRILPTYGDREPRADRHLHRPDAAADGLRDRDVPVPAVLPHHPPELVEAARVDAAGPLKFFWDILLPLSKTNIAALFVILFIYGWTQYLWPLLVTNDNQMNTIIIAVRKMVSFADADTPWNTVMVTSILAIVPPIMIVVLMQRWFVKGLVETEK